MSLKQPHIDSGVYVLRLEGGKFYVGASEDIYDRIDGHSSSWTDQYEPIELLDVFPSKQDIKQLEREVTIMYMERYGWENVRGAGWTRSNMSQPPKVLTN